jgi:hypothetical protein
MEEHGVSRKRACDAFAGPSFQKPNATPFTHEPLGLSGRIQSGFAGLSVSVVLVGLTRAHLLDLDEQSAFSGS